MSDRKQTASASNTLHVVVDRDPLVKLFIIKSMEQAVTHIFTLTMAALPRTIHGIATERSTLNHFVDIQQLSKRSNISSMPMPRRDAARSGKTTLWRDRSVSARLKPSKVSIC